VAVLYFQNAHITALFKKWCGVCDVVGLGFSGKLPA